jgi:hypothetical protein
MDVQLALPRSSHDSGASREQQAWAALAGAGSADGRRGVAPASGTASGLGSGTAAGSLFS